LEPSPDRDLSLLELSPDLDLSLFEPSPDPDFSLDPESPDGALSEEDPFDPDDSVVLELLARESVT
jgi:hypothetical protein